MAEITPEPHRRRKHWPIVLAFFALLIAGGAFAVHQFLRAENLTAMLIGQTRNTLGAELVLDGVATFELWPNLHLQLPKPRLRVPSSNDVLVGAEAIDIAMPWHSLWRDRVDIESIELIRPVLDLDAWSAWRYKQPPSAAAPDVRFSVRVRDGSVRAGGKLVASGIDATFANSGDLAAWFDHLHNDTSTALALPSLGGKLDAKSIDVGSTHIDDLHVEIVDDVPPPNARKP